MPKKRLYLRMAALAGLITFLLCLSGCFDYEISLRLKENGSGDLRARLVTLPDAVDEVMENWVPLAASPQPGIYRERAGERAGVVEKASFKHLQDLAARNIVFSIKEIHTGTLGMTDATYRLTAVITPGGEALSDRKILPGMAGSAKVSKKPETDPGRKKAADLVRKSFDKRYFKLAFFVPGELEQALPIALGHVRIKPVINDKGRLVEWRVPVSVLINEKIRHRMIFTADFKGEYRFRKSRSASSRPATAKQIAVAQERLLKGTP